MMNRVFRYAARVAIVLVAIATMSGCFKSKTTDTLLVLKVLVEEKSGDDKILAEDVQIYGYELENDDWYIASYDDALNGIITDSLATQKLTVPDLRGEKFEKEGLTQYYTAIPLTSSPTMVVVVCPSAKMFAYSFRTLDVINMTETYITLLLHKWKSAYYTEGADTKGGMWYIFPPEEEEDNTNTGSDTTNNAGSQTKI
ncbi:MAG: hypothetical protein IKC42_01840 [Alistipes sp.]|nr:hypothetical protein [Alistipes sp.]